MDTGAISKQLERGDTCTRGRMNGCRVTGQIQKQSRELCAESDDPRGFIRWNVVVEKALERKEMILHRLTVSTSARRRVTGRLEVDGENQNRGCRL